MRVKHVALWASWATLRVCSVIECDPIKTILQENIMTKDTNEPKVANEPNETNEPIETNEPNEPNLSTPPVEGGIIRFLKEGEVCARTTLARATLWRKIRDGTFPAQIQINGGRVAWYEHEVQAWILNPII